MKVLHIDTGTGWRGGQQQVLWLIEELRQRGWEQSLAAPAGSPLAERVRSDGFEVTGLAHRAVSFTNLRSLRRQVAAFDLIHAHDAHAHTLAWLVLTATGKSRPRLVVSRRVGFPIQGTFGRAKYGFADAYLAVSEFVRQRLLAAQVPAEKIHVVRDGVRPPVVPPDPEQRTAFRRQHGAEDQVFLLGTLTSLAPEKLLEQAIELLAELPPSVCLWVGRPAAEAKKDKPGAEAALLELARRQGVEGRLRILALAEPVGPFLDSLDVFLYLSEMEGLGSAILLAMAHGLPVVASRAGGIPEIVSHEQTGLLVDGHSPEELSGPVRWLLDSPALRRRLAAAGREFVLAHATSAIMAAQTAAVYEELLQGSNQHTR